jgi:hypothetical protein
MKKGLPSGAIGTNYCTVAENKAIGLLFWGITALNMTVFCIRNLQVMYCGIVLKGRNTMSFTVSLIGCEIPLLPGVMRFIKKT